MSMAVSSRRVVLKRMGIYFCGDCHRGLALAAVVFAGCAFGQQNSVLDRARQLDAAGRCAEAETLYQGALRSSTDVAVLNNFGNHYLACREPEKARGIFERLLKMDSGHANANLQMARLAEQKKEPAKALAYLDQVAKPDVEIQMTRAEVLAGMGRRDDAARIL